MKKKVFSVEKMKEIAHRSLTSLSKDVSQHHDAFQPKQEAATLKEGCLICRCF